MNNRVCCTLVWVHGRHSPFSWSWSSLYMSSKRAGYSCSHPPFKLLSTKVLLKHASHSLLRIWSGFGGRASFMMIWMLSVLAVAPRMMTISSEGYMINDRRFFPGWSYSSGSFYSTRWLGSTFASNLGCSMIRFFFMRKSVSFLQFFGTRSCLVLSVMSGSFDAP